ncbi:RNA pyrophosphohydrolase [Gammaproteobacteria bacterium]|nr:RNA pyrophosphohydrolase [Gammaproteobacteria bacterium]
MTLKIKTGYRLNVAMIVLNKDNKVLFCKRRNTENWQFPQGGVDKNENIESAMFRELNEEVGLEKDNVEIKAVSQNLIYYDIPKNIRSRVLGGKFKGQAQKYFLLKLISGDVDLNIENTPEFDKYSWVSFWYPLYQVVDFKKEAYRSALIELKNQINI